ncbi:MAG: peroxidase-related enzyme [Burkholderiales bacterium]|nr:peroxidase-related enzyme [Burkholderiales bacterium]
MSRVTLLDTTTATPAAGALLQNIHQAFGATPNMFKAVAHSPAALQMMWSAFGALGGGALPARLGEQIAVAVAERNGCDYCLAAHTALGRKAGASADEMRDAQAGESADPKTQAALRFALQLVNQRGHVAEADVAALRDAGFDEPQLVEIVAHVALNLFTNYVNVALAVPVDFPAVPLRRVSPA